MSDVYLQIQKALNLRTDFKIEVFSASNFIELEALYLLIPHTQLRIVPVHSSKNAKQGTKT